MRLRIIATLALVLAASAHAETTFQRPDCSAFQGISAQPESRCFRKKKMEVREQNRVALQKAGLEFVYLGRPPARLDAYPLARKAVEDKTEGEFLIHFSVNTDGDVHDVKIVSATSQPISELAKLWANTIAQWKFTKGSQPVADVPFRRIYLFSSEDNNPRESKSGS